jgi:hypothetical protein
LSGHTPGPWLASEYIGPPFHDGERGSRVDAVAAADYPATRPIAIVHGDNAVWLRDGEAEANALLVAAAPDLLAVVERYRVLIVLLNEAGVMIPLSLDDKIRSLNDRASAAILKARGGK